MEKTAFIEQLQVLTANEDVLTVSRDVNELRSKFEDFLLEEGRLRQVAELEAQEKGETLEEQETGDAIKDEFYAMYNVYKEKRKQVIEERNALESENLKKKRALISKLQAVIAEEEHIGAAFGTYKEIQESWKNIGAIPRDKRQDVQNEYSRLLEEFFYNINIYRQIKEYDLKKNSAAKSAIIVKIKALEEIEVIKDVEVLLKALQHDWDEVGPTEQEDWEKLKDEYWTSVKATWDRIQKFYDARKEQYEKNLETKKEILSIAKMVVAKENATVKDWDESTKDIIQLQATWKNVGYGPKKENEEVWKEFRAECDAFFAKKSEFFEEIRSKYDAVAAKKQALVDQVEALKSSTDWKDTTHKIIQLQKDWKGLGNAGQKNEQSLWKAFRGGCDSFFNAKQKFYEEQDKHNEVNLSAKEDIITQIEKFEVPEDRNEAVKSLKEFSAAFNAIGNVPFKEKDRIYQTYKAALDKHYDQMKFDGAEKDRVMFEAKLDTLKASPNAAKMLDREKQDIRNKITELKQEITQYENNLGFFANSKGANALKQEVERKITATHSKITSLKDKLKLIPNE